MLLSVDNGYRFYKIEKPEEFRKIRQWLVLPMKEMQDQLPSVKTAEQLLDETDGKLVSKGDYFGLWLVTNHGEVIITLITSVILNENYELCCYVSGRYFKKGTMRSLIGPSFHYLEKWAKEKQYPTLLYLTCYEPHPRHHLVALSL